MSDYYEIHPHAGSAWVKACAIWADYVAHESWTFGFIWTSFYNGVRYHLTLKIIVTQDDGAHNYYLIFGDVPLITSTGLQPLDYIGSRPGFASAPPVVRPSYGTRDTIADYHANMHPLRLQMVYNCSGLSAGSDSYVDGAGFGAWMFFRTYSTQWVNWLGAFVLIDQVCVQIGDLKAANDTAPDNPYMIGVQSGSGGGGGGAAPDLGPITNAVNRIALKDYTFSFNNGSTLFSVNGVTRVD